MVNIGRPVNPTVLTLQDELLLPHLADERKLIWLGEAMPKSLLGSQPLRKPREPVRSRLPLSADDMVFNRKNKQNWHDFRIGQQQMDIPWHWRTILQQTALGGAW